MPVFLAGGLGADNGRDAMRAVSPFGVDLRSGVRTGGALDRRLPAEFLAEVRRADANLARKVCCAPRGVDPY